MNRRSFLSSIIQAGAAAAILPAAVTYARHWKRTKAGLVVPIPVARYLATVVSSLRDREITNIFLLKDGQFNLLPDIGYPWKQMSFPESNGAIVKFVKFELVYGTASHTPDKLVCL